MLNQATPRDQRTKVYHREDIKSSTLAVFRFSRRMEIFCYAIVISYDLMYGKIIFIISDSLTEKVFFMKQRRYLVIFPVVVCLLFVGISLSQP